MTTIKVKELSDDFHNLEQLAQNHGIPVVTKLHDILTLAAIHNASHESISTQVDTLLELRGSAHRLSLIATRGSLAGKESEYRLEITDQIRGIRRQLLNPIIMGWHESCDEGPHTVYTGVRFSKADAEEVLGKMRDAFTDLKQVTE